MIESIMYFAVGFLAASLLALVIMPFVHGRAVRLTVRRLEALTPVSMAEIQADKDQLRAEFAMSTRRLEMSVEQLKSKTTSQLADLGKKTEAITRLKLELGEKTATIFALEAREKGLRDQLRATEDELSVKTGALREAESALADTETALSRLTGAHEGYRGPVLARKTRRRSSIPGAGRRARNGGAGERPGRAIGTPARRADRRGRDSWPAGR